MMKFFAASFFVLFITMLALMLPYFRSMREFLATLRSEAESKWQELGAPTALFDASPGSMMRVVSYIWRGSFADVPAASAILARKVRKYLIANCIVGVTAVIAGVAGAIAGST